MILLAFIPVVVLSVLVVDKFHITNGFVITNPLAHEEFDAICDVLTKDPRFIIELLVKKKWRIYYTWNNNISDICVDVTFKYANHLMVNHIRNTMYRYLQSKPNWADAKLFMNMAGSRHALLLADSDGVPGRFIQVPHLVPVVRDQVISRMPSSREIPLFKMAIKMFREGRYFILSDCSSGITSVLADRKKKPNRKDIAALVSTVDFGVGSQACIIA